MLQNAFELVVVEHHMPAEEDGQVPAPQSLLEPKVGYFSVLPFFCAPFFCLLFVFSFALFLFLPLLFIIKNLVPFLLLFSFFFTFSDSIVQGL